MATAAPLSASKHWRFSASALVIAAGVLVFAFVVQRHQPLGNWLFFHYLRAAVLAGVFSVSCLVAGHAVLVRVLRRVLPVGEHLAIAFPLGVFAFFLTS